ncbi:hypothetical protein PBT90_02425 [Algoriphagus halophytocola]|uniref:hypothetical protein n=1 Tax=Algoriphagus halophytocola TaxID=2991499 RepID=UPI0022DD3873|nr:hypothetical protein [Algoriphagus sp. TR-M9]WBL43547.1 hypothetical protein PBT90_02425 [Algoriphagus sp. TR-M9]
MLIRIFQNRFYFSDEKSFGLSETSLADVGINFKDNLEIFWEVLVEENYAVEGEICLKTINYYSQSPNKFEGQTIEPDVKFIWFMPFKWSQIEGQLSSYSKKKLIEENIVYIDEKMQITYRNQEELGRKSIGSIMSFEAPIVKEPVVEKIEEIGKIYYNDIDFDLGKVSFSFKSKVLGQTFNLELENPILRKEFNTIKSYFPKVLGGRKYFTIKVVFTLRGEDVIDKKVSSEEIQSIDDKVIGQIKDARIENLISTPVPYSDEKTLFNAEDIFGRFNEASEEGNVFNQTEEEIISTLINKKKIRNAKHLQFLSGHKHSPKLKIHFTLKPYFGFVFFVEGRSKKHFCWELLETHATYLWSFEKLENEKNQQLEVLQKIISQIKIIGREKYKKTVRESSDNQSFEFHAIDHLKINTSEKEAFQYWKQRLLPLLV